MEMEYPVHVIKGSSHWESAIFINGCAASSFIHRCHDSRRRFKLPLLGRDGGLSPSCIKKTAQNLAGLTGTVYITVENLVIAADVRKPTVTTESSSHVCLLKRWRNSNRLWSHFVTSNLNGAFSSAWFWVEENQTLMCRAGQWICSRAKSILNYLLVSDCLQQPPS